MSLSFLTGWRTDRADRGIALTSFGGRSESSPLMVETLEGRTLMSAAPAAAAQAAAHHGGGPEINLNKLREQLRKAEVNVGQIANVAVKALTQNLTLDSATGDLVGTTTAALRLPDGSVVNLPLSVTLDPAGGAAETAGSAATPAAVGDVPVLHLMLGPIDLNLLGLRVQTSPICLNITANPAGGILGQLLAGLAGPGGLLGNILGNLQQITDAINNILNGLNLNLGLTGVTQQAGRLVGNFTVGLSSGAASTSQAVSSPLDFTPAAAPAAAGTTILNLNLGPINLSLLGLNVKLDNCNNGPINVKITAVPGPGNLLGNLLSGIAGALDGGTPLTRLVNSINRLLDKLDRFLGDNTANA